MSDLLTLLRELYPDRIIFPQTLHLFFKLFDIDTDKTKTPSNWNKQFYCDDCNVMLPNQDSSVNEYIICSRCGGKCDKNKHFFVRLPVKPQLVNILSNPGLYHLIKDRNATASADVCNGAYYNLLKNNNTICDDDITLQFNTDGVNPFKSSRRSVWPLFLQVNELPSSFRRRNTILCGMWLGENKPNVTLLLEDLVNELVELSEHGMEISTSDGKNTKVIKAHLILCCVDSVARPPIQNIKQFNGECGCTYCLQKGVILPGTINNRVYPDCEMGRLRTEKQHLKDAQTAIDRNISVNGVKGPCILGNILTFDVGKCFGFDYMHTVMLGVVHCFVDAWLDSSNHDKPFYVGNKIDSIDERLVSIKPPVEISRSPRSLKDRAKWKAIEWKYFLLFYSLHCVAGILPRNYVKHWSKLVFSIHIYLKSEISDEESMNASCSIQSFVQDVENLYGQAFYKYNLHMLLHIPKCVENFGALWNTSLFSYEHYNGVLCKMFKNSNGILQQIAKNYYRFKNLQKMVFSLSNFDSVVEPGSLLEHYIIKFFGYNTTAANSRHPEFLQSSSSVCVVEMSLTLLVAVERLLNVRVDVKSLMYPFMRINGILYHSHSCNQLKKRNNSCARLSDGSFAIIHKILKVSSNVGTFTTNIVEYEALISINSETHRGISVEADLVFHRCRKSNIISARKLDDVIQKCILIADCDRDDYCTVIPLGDSVL